MHGRDSLTNSVGSQINVASQGGKFLSLAAILVKVTLTNRRVGYVTHGANYVCLCAYVSKLASCFRVSQPGNNDGRISGLLVKKDFCKTV